MFPSFDDMKAGSDFLDFLNTAGSSIEESVKWYALCDVDDNIVPTRICFGNSIYTGEYIIDTFQFTATKEIDPDSRLVDEAHSDIHINAANNGVADQIIEWLDLHFCGGERVVFEDDFNDGVIDGRWVSDQSAIDGSSGVLLFEDDDVLTINVPRPNSGCDSHYLWTPELELSGDFTVVHKFKKKGSGTSGFFITADGNLSDSIKFYITTNDTPYLRIRSYTSGSESTIYQVGNSGYINVDLEFRVERKSGLFYFYVNDNLVRENFHHPVLSSDTSLKFNFETGTCRWKSGDGLDEIDSFKVTEACADLENGLVAYYPLDNDAKDHSGNVHHGISNGIFFDGRSADFDGNDHIYIPWSPQNVTQLSVSAMLYLRSDDTSSDYILGSATGNSNSDRTNLRFGTQFGKPWIGLRNAASQSVLVLSNEAITNGWHLITFTWDGSALKLFVDDKLSSSSPFTGTMNIQYDLTIGAVNDKNVITSFFDGRIADLRIWDRAISEGEIKEVLDQTLIVGNGTFSGSE